MKDVEKMLSDKRCDINEIPVPEELESKLKGALTNITFRKRKTISWRVKVAAFLLAATFLVYHADTLAYYGKTLTGFDEIMNNPLKRLNELGKGQIVDKKYRFSNGTTVTLEGIMLDDNQLIAFYTVENPNDVIEEVDLGPHIFMKGMFGRHDFKSATGLINDNETEIKYIAEFEPPYFFEKKLEWIISQEVGNSYETGKITFYLDRNKAMKQTLKKEINENIKIDDVNIRFDTIKASPTITRIEGQVQNILELAYDEISGERLRPTEIGIKLFANGKEVNIQSSGMRTDMKGITFERNYDALPSDIKSLQLKLESFGADREVKNIIELKKGELPKTIDILKQNVIIDKVYEDKGDTYVTITTEDSVILSRVYILLDGQRVELQETISDRNEKMPDGTITHTRTLHFKGTGNKLDLEIQRIKYTEIFNKIIDIPVD
jgi:hypothetical protein